MEFSTRGGGPTIYHNFPWINFYNGHHRKLINRWEIRALTYGLEIRSIFLDKNLIQEWLNLSVFLKNKEHKYFLKEYLRKKNINIPNRTAGMKSQSLWEKEYGHQSSV